MNGNFNRNYRMILIFIILIFLSLNIYIFEGSGSTVLTPTTKMCMSCHDGSVGAPKNIHNNTIMCEQCHTGDTHSANYIQPDGTFGPNKLTSATCIDCHVIGVNGFNSPMVPDTKHSSRINNGSIWGAYWSNDRYNISCLYCHGDTKHDTNALGKINNLTDDPTNIRDGPISETTWCADCHINKTGETINNYYRGDIWNSVPPLITIKNTGNNDWIDHTSYLNNQFGDAKCRSCHPISGSYSEYSSIYVHSIKEVSRDACVDCHSSAY